MLIWLTVAMATPLAEAVNAYVQPLVDEGIADEMVVTVVSDGQVRFMTYGEATPDTVFEIGSVSKTFTGLLLADAVEREALTLEHEVPPMVAGMRTFEGQAPTLRDLATHTSGLPRLPEGFQPDDPSDPYAHWDAAAFTSDLAKTSLVAAPGETYAYSNLGVTALGRALATAGGQPWHELVRTRITDPLGMTQTRVDGPQPVTGHDADGREVRPWTSAAMAPAGGLHSTSRDMARYLAAHLHPKDDLGRAMQRATAVDKTIGPNLKMGLTWHITDAGVVWHNGQTGGFHAVVAMHPEQQVGVVVLANTAQEAIDHVGFAVLELALGGEPKPAPVQRAVPVEADALKARAGRYGPSEVRFEDGRLWLALPDQPAYGLYPTSESAFFMRAAPVTVTFEDRHLVFRQQGLPEQRWKQRKR